MLKELTKYKKMSFSLVRKFRTLNMRQINQSSVARKLASIRDCAKEPEIIVPKGAILVDERIEIRVNNLRQFQSVTLRVELKSEKPVLYESYGHYIADKDGRLNLSRDSSFGGTYKGKDNMGLFWSMLPVPGQRKGIRFTQEVVTKPLEFTIFLFDGHVMSQKEVGDVEQALEILPESIATRKILRTYLAGNVERQEISVGRIRGTLFMPKGERKFPGVIDMFGNHGGLIEFRAAILASHGFVTLALALFAYKDLPKSYRNVELEYFMEAAKWLASHEKVYSSGIGCVGVSLGGQIALQLSAMCSLIKAVVAVSSPDHILFLLKHQGKAIGYTKQFKLENADRTEDNALITKDLIKESELESVQIPVEKIEGKIMIVAGNNDLSINCVDSAKRMTSRLKRSNRPPPYVINYPRAGHLIEVPFMPMCSFSYIKTFGSLFAWGGDVIEHAAAQEHAWCSIKRFLFDNI